MTTAAQSIDHKPQSQALAALANRMTNDQHFANEFFGAIDRKDEKRSVELAKQTITPDVAEGVAFHAAPSAAGICICYKGYCLCLVKQ